jgi:hypothetical protein
MFLNDQETATNLLYYEAIAKTIARLIRETPDAPVTIGVHGDWGAGKSSVLKMLERAFARDDRAYQCALGTACHRNLQLIGTQLRPCWRKYAIKRSKRGSVSSSGMAD